MASDMYRLISMCIMLFILGMCLTSTVLAQNSIVSPLNGKVLDSSNTTKNYSFFLIGHVYGNPESPSVYPSASFLSNIDMLNHNNASFFILMGDNFQKCEPDYIENFKKSILSKIDVPVFNAVGNHDVGNRELYGSHFGMTFYDFVYGSEMYIILDSEINQGEIAGDQLNYLNNAVQNAIDANEVKNVIIIIHKLIWTVGDDELKPIYQNLNAQSGYAKNDEFQSIILPQFVRLSKTKNVYVASGDIGVSWSLPLFYHKDERYNITYVASGIGDTKRDAIIRVDISEGEVTFSPISLTGEELHGLSYYDVNYWTSHFGNNALFDRINRISHNIYFQFGVVLTAFISCVFAGTIILYTRRENV